MHIVKFSFKSTRPIYIPAEFPKKTTLVSFDNTFRDGEQVPGAAMTAIEKLAVARKLVELQVDFIKAGFLASFEDNYKATEMITKVVEVAVDDSDFLPIITTWERCVEGDIDKT